uniref:RING-type E3 ubiquitin transferase n=1 Tax=Amphimedon queenslandica TaxID=400682 RepID=A0A1X7U7Y8_AMPQE
MASDSLFGGYDVQFVERHRELAEKYMCVICRMVPRDVHQLTCCGKLICHHCVEDYKRKSSHNCPVCRKHGLNYFNDTSRNQEILSLKVFCYYKEHRCQWVGELRDLIREHAHICVYKLVQCEQCGARVPETGLGDHLASSCVKRMFSCQYCKEAGSFEFIQETHLNECPERPIECPNGGCRITVKRKDIEAHRNVCMQQLVHCCYHLIGCNIMMKRMLKPAHEANCSKRGIKSLAHRKDTLPLNICIDNFESRKENKEVWEQDFFTKDGGYFMTLKVHLVGCKSDSIGCYFHMRAGPHDSSLSWPFRGIFVLTLLNQKMDDNHYSREIKFLTTKCDSYNSRLTGCDKATIGIGEPEYVTHSFLSQCTQYRKYLQDNKMILHVSIMGTDNCKSAIGFYHGCR